jgi:hypothetical protein
MRRLLIAFALLLAGCATNFVPASATVSPDAAEMIQLLFRSEGTPMTLHSSCRKAGRRWDATTVGRYVATLVDYNLAHSWIAARAVTEETAAGPAWRLTIVFHTADDFLVNEEEIDFLVPWGAGRAIPDSFRCRYSVTYLQELPEYER